MSIDDERAAFMRDLLLVLTSLYSWAGAVVNGQTRDGYDIIELADETKVWTEPVPTAVGYGACYGRFGGPIVPFWITVGRTRIIAIHDLARAVTKEIAAARIRDLLSGPP